MTSAAARGAAVEAAGSRFIGPAGPARRAGSPAGAFAGHRATKRRTKGNLRGGVLPQDHGAGQAAEAVNGVSLPARQAASKAATTAGSNWPPASPWMISRIVPSSILRR